MSLSALFESAGLSDVMSENVAATAGLESVDEHLRFSKDAFGALHMLMAGMSDDEKAESWGEVAEALAVYDGPDGFVAPGELVVCTGRVNRRGEPPNADRRLLRLGRDCRTEAAGFHGVDAG